jgi:hypothetical protein
VRPPRLEQGQPAPARALARLHELEGERAVLLVAGGVAVDQHRGAGRDVADSCDGGAATSSRSVTYFKPPEEAMDPSAELGTTNRLVALALAPAARPDAGSDPPGFQVQVGTGGPDDRTTLPPTSHGDAIWGPAAATSCAAALAGIA